MPDFRFKRLAYVALNVTDGNRTGAFLRDIVGLADGAPAQDGTHFLRCSADHHNIVLYTAGAPGLRRVAFEMESAADLEAARKHVADLGLAPVEVSDRERRVLGIDRAIRFSEPASGLTVELLTGMAQLDSPFTKTHTQIVRLGHMVVSSVDQPRTLEFFTKQLNFRVSDIVEGLVTFTRCFPNPLHHSFGVSTSSENRLHHVNFMVSDIDDIGRALNRLKKNNIPIVYGPGRHPPSGSVFLYFLDPDGMTWELSFGMEEFPERDAREPRVLPKSLESFDFWGGQPEARFASVGPIDRRDAVPA
jgi:2,3-dihydroxy-p-cumate/2,3-dihydroxybenzoate 3,4-dioxygenase